MQDGEAGGQIQSVILFIFDAGRPGAVIIGWLLLEQNGYPGRRKRTVGGCIHRWFSKPIGFTDYRILTFSSVIPRQLEDVREILCVYLFDCIIYGKAQFVKWILNMHYKFRIMCFVMQIFVEGTTEYYYRLNFLNELRIELMNERYQLQSRRPATNN